MSSAFESRRDTFSLMRSTVSLADCWISQRRRMRACRSGSACRSSSAAKASERPPGPRAACVDEVPPSPPPSPPTPIWLAALERSSSRLASLARSSSHSSASSSHKRFASSSGKSGVPRQQKRCGGCTSACRVICAGLSLRRSESLRTVRPSGLETKPGCVGSCFTPRRTARESAAGCIGTPSVPMDAPGTLASRRTRCLHALSARRSSTLASHPSATPTHAWSRPPLIRSRGLVGFARATARCFGWGGIQQIKVFRERWRKEKPRETQTAKTGEERVISLNFTSSARD